MDPNRNSWPHVREWLIDEIGKAQLSLESPALDPLQTAHLRGKIAAWRIVLRTGDGDVAEPTATNPSGYY